MKTELKARMQIMKQVRDAIKAPYAFPGGYEKFAICNDGAVLCTGCLKEEHEQVAHDTLKGWVTGWDVARVDCVVNHDGPIVCDNCNKELQKQVTYWIDCPACGLENIPLDGQHVGDCPKCGASVNTELNAIPETV